MVSSDIGQFCLVARLMMVERSPPPQYSMTMQRIPVSIDVSVVASYNVVLLCVCYCQSAMKLYKSIGRTHTSAIICFLSPLTHPLKAEFLTCEYLREKAMSLGTRKCPH